MGTTSLPTTANPVGATVPGPAVQNGYHISLPRGTPFWMTVALVAIVAAFSIVTPPGTFFSLSNFQDIGRDAAQLILIAVGMTFLLGAGLLDLSVGANLVIASVVGALVIRSTASGSNVSGLGLAGPAVLGAAACVASGAVFGLINGLLVTVAKINAFIATLGTMGIAGGLVLVITGGADIANIPVNLQNQFGVLNIAYVPVLVIIVAPIVAVLWIGARKTTLGIRTLAIGSDQEAARRAGITVEAQMRLLFVLVGALAGVGGFLDMVQLGSTDILGHASDALAAIAAAVIGGTSLFGGRMSIGGTLAGAFIPIVLSTGLVICGLSPYYQEVVVGAVLLVAVYLDRRRRVHRQ
jgi:ribose transport system permease protein